MTKTHWKKLYNPNYFGAWCFEPGKDMVLTVDHVIQEVVSDEKGRKEQCMVVYFRERGAKPMICNKTNSKSLEKLAGSPYIEDWAGVKLQLYVDHNVRFGSPCCRNRIHSVLLKSSIPDRCKLCSGFPASCSKRCKIIRPDPAAFPLQQIRRELFYQVRPVDGKPVILGKCIRRKKSSQIRRSRNYRLRSKKSSQFPAKRIGSSHMSGKQ